jgi:hypothetical protein
VIRAADHRGAENGAGVQTCVGGVERPGGLGAHLVFSSYGINTIRNDEKQALFANAKIGRLRESSTTTREKARP